MCRILRFILFFKLEDMKIEPMFINKDGRDVYEFKINDDIILEIGKTAVSVLKINLPLFGHIEEHFKSIREQFDIEKMTSDLLSKNAEISKIVIDGEVCRANDKIVFQVSDLEKYKK